MSLMLGNQNSGLRTLVQWLVIGAIVGAVLNSKDIQRYLKIRVDVGGAGASCHASASTPVSRR